MLGETTIAGGLAPRLSLPERPPGSADASLAVSAVEVPDLLGLTSDEAGILLSAAGFEIRVRTAESTGSRSADVVIEQDPVGGVLTEVGSTVSLVFGSRPVEGSATAAPKKLATPAKASRFVVCIDPGHQDRSDSTPEPIGPDSKTMKARVTGGATGVVTQVPEYETALQISMNLKKRLEADGVKVVMTRTTNDVNLSNSERASIANKAKADLFVRVHADGSPDGSVSGISTLYPSSNRWTSGFVDRSKSAARRVQASVVAQTGAIDRGIKARSDLSGFNWSRVPVVLVECGFLSNSIEDRLLTSPHYQDNVAGGIAAGVMGYLDSRTNQ
jgi:N-acetylmuramoyl-L-alanine amidase